MAIGGKLFSPANYPRSWRALIAAKYSNSKVDVIPYVPGEGDVAGDFSKKFPLSEVPCFESTNGDCLFDANAIAYYLGNEQLRGGKNEALVTQWVNFAENRIAPAVASLVYPCLGVSQPDKKCQGVAKEAIASIMKYLNNYLASRTYLVSERISQADITMFTSLYLLMTHTYDAASRAPFSHVVRWYQTIGNQPEVVQVVGPFKLCEKAAQFDPKLFAELNKKQEGSGKKQAQEGKEKQKTPSKPKDQAPKNDEDDAPKEKPKDNPLAKLPVGTFVMDEFKRTYCNNDIATVGLPYLWENFDSENYSIWHCSYKYPQELKLVFMSSNLIGGVFQRLEKMLKLAFGSMFVLGKDKDNTICGLFIWRGTGLIMELDSDLQTDYESFNWKKLDPKSPETKKMVSDYFNPDEEIDGKPIAVFKLFK